MKLQIDTNTKTLKLEESVSLTDLMELLDKLFPDKSWKEYKLETNTTIQWTGTPYHIPFRPYVPYNPVYPWWSVTGSAGNLDIRYRTIGDRITEDILTLPKSDSGVYNIEMQ